MTVVVTALGMTYLGDRDCAARCTAYEQYSSN
jgi:hypothetical protein